MLRTIELCHTFRACRRAGRKEAARRFAAVDVGDAPRPEIWTLVEW